MGQILALSTFPASLIWGGEFPVTGGVQAEHMARGVVPPKQKEDPAFLCSLVSPPDSQCPPPSPPHAPVGASWPRPAPPSLPPDQTWALPLAG